ncbi:MAG: phospho-N-acetylmuramoyl-pentapeptide-transferase [Bacillota bacterium]
MGIHVAATLILTFLITIISYPLFIKRMRLLQYGQQIREDGPSSHSQKAGTPTMGGVVFVIAATLVSIIFKGQYTLIYALLLVMLGCGLLGFLDDYFKVVYQRSLGLKARSKLAGQVITAIIFLLILNQFNIYSSIIILPFTAITFDLGYFYPLFVFLIVTSATNAVNLTDGVDGLAAGTAVMALSAYIYIAWLTGKPEAAVFAASLAGGCLGFLLYNRNPAKVFMGDAGSLALGGAFAALAILTKSEMLLIIIGGVFVIETLSVIAQVASFQLFGRRIFRMSPLHHHFELTGWSEWQVAKMFWAAAAAFAVLGMFAYNLQGS